MGIDDIPAVPRSTVTETQRTSQRTTMAGTLRPEDVGSSQRVTGWVHRRRNLGGLYFLDPALFDQLLQVCVDISCSPGSKAQFQVLGIDVSHHVIYVGQPLLKGG